MRCLNSDLSQIYGMNGVYDIYRMCCKLNQDICPFAMQCHEDKYQYMNREDNNIDTDEYN
ncbi:hypothetical protein [Romboutsia weinsteinii]|uniref:hypothetical protein n=1 Tax=Romboutsia weinsteinii TaxID=2020949 RepID=UPI0013142D27|nr:hypothetical protein [Romboutsia weinsteinii]